uniref:Uncharacterized protein n=1 Tax=Kwoniella bestiolae CBS 10118 TaxID=1296100 RepID=A0A1B9FSQ9_9TREE|nr:hypothetical protein I302_08583 [Kwoniella bestiolae CBS 10118]OCF21804.1 hypothetical protein I302_08583 [Kwoniella bestiolae CBS 10118]
MLSLPLFLLPLLLLTPISVYSHPTKRQQEQDQPTPRVTGLYISSIRDGSCISTNDSVPVVGSQLVLTDCERAETWHVPNGDGLLGLDTVALVWDLHENENEDMVFVDAPVEGLTSQLWKWSSDNRISSINGTICLQHTPGRPTAAQCDAMNVDQAWILRNTSQPQHFDDIDKQPNSNRNGYIHPKSASEAYVGSGLAMTYCTGKGDGTSYLPISTSESLFTWALPKLNQKGQVKLSSKNLCLETGLKTPNSTGGYEWSYIYGMGVTLQECDIKKEGQEWVWDGEVLRIGNQESSEFIHPSILSITIPSGIVIIGSGVVYTSPIRSNR